MDRFDALSFRVFHEGRGVIHRPTKCQWALVGHVANPHQISGLDGWFSPMDASHHAVGSVHQEGDGSMVNFHPFEGLRVFQKTAEGEKYTSLFFLVEQFDDQRCSVNKHHRPRPVFSHFKKGPVDVQVNGQIRFQLLEKRSDVLSSNGPSFPDAPFIGHACHMGAEAIILGHRVVDEPKAAHRSMAMWCTIRTFAKHAIELGNQPVADPIFFVKPEGCLHESGPLPVSAHPGEVHHEVECVVKLDEASRPVAIAVGLDLTDRATQGELRAEQLPWAKAKCFRSSAVIGPFVPWDGTWEDLVDPAQGLQLDLSVNGTLRQSAPLHEMSVTPRQQIDSLHRWAPVNGGDVLFTGTPAGVGRLLPGDQVVARLLQANGEPLSQIDVGCE